MKWSAFPVFIVCSILLSACSPEEVPTIYSKVKVSDHSLNDLLFVKDSVVYTVSGDTWYSGGIHVSTNAGNSWKTDTISAVGLNSLALSPSGRMFAGGYAGFLFTKEVNAPWQQINIGTYDIYKSISYSPQGRLFLASGTSFFYGKIFQANENLEITQQDSLGIDLRQILYFDDLNYAAIGYGGTYYSSDAGMKWIRTDLIGDNFTSAVILDQNTAVGIGFNGTLIKTKNKGKAWEKIDGGSNFDVSFPGFSKIILLNDGSLVVCGRKGNIWITTNEGKSWKKAETFTDAHFTSMINKGQQIYLTASDGNLYRVLF